jgi:cardiolipin synthase A/B
MSLLAFIDMSSLTGIIALLDVAVVVATLFWILYTKREPTSAIAWCLLVIFVPLFGVLFFIVFGYQSIHPPLKKKKRHAEFFRGRSAPEGSSEDAGYEGLAALARQLGARPLVGGNDVRLFHDGQPAYDAMLEAIRGATHHIHMQFFIIRADQSGDLFMAALAERARAGVEIRFLYDAVGSWRLSSRSLRGLRAAGGKAIPFLPFLNPLRRRAQINLRNHRKVLIVDGRIGFTGGLNLGDEYLGKDPFFGPWRDDFVRVEGPAVRGLQRVFTEDWDFAADEDPLEGDSYFPKSEDKGTARVQVAWSGPDQDIRTIREVYFAAIMRARKRVWLATPYFVPDAGLHDALCLAARSGRDVRVLCPFRPDKWIPHLASRYNWDHLLAAGAKVYQYTAGFLHTKRLMIDDVWSSIGTANFDNRSLLLNFEVTCLIESVEVQAGLERAFLRDLESSIRLEMETFRRRPFVAKMAENGCRLLSPVL